MRKTKVVWFILFVFSAALFSCASGDRKNVSPDEYTPFQIQSMAKSSLDEMVNAYVSKNIRAFMNSAAEDYDGEKRIFESSVRRDFSRFHDIDISYSINNVTSDSSGKLVYVSLNFTRAYTDIKTTQRVIETKTGELIFKIINGKAKIYSMRGDKMFGISQP